MSIERINSYKMLPNERWLTHKKILLKIERRGGNYFHIIDNMKIEIKLRNRQLAGI